MDALGGAIECLAAAVPSVTRARFEQHVRQLEQVDSPELREEFQQEYGTDGSYPVLLGWTKEVAAGLVTVVEELLEWGESLPEIGPDDAFHGEGG